VVFCGDAKKTSVYVDYQCKFFLAIVGPLVEFNFRLFMLLRKLPIHRFP